MEPKCLALLDEVKSYGTIKQDASSPHVKGALTWMYTLMETVRWNRKTVIEILINKSGMYKLNGRYLCSGPVFLASLIKRN